MTGVIETDGLGKQYGRKWALQDCTLIIPEGKVVGLVGPNGAGKSTLLNLAVGLLAPTSGTIEVLGVAPGPQPTGRGLMAQVPAVRGHEEHGGAGGGEHPGRFEVPQVVADHDAARRVAHGEGGEFGPA